MSTSQVTSSVRGGFLNPLRVFWQRIWYKPEPRKLSIETTSSSFSLKTEPGIVVEWASVTEVVAFKRDLFAIDLICIAVQTENGYIEVDEEMDGYAQFLTELESQFELKPNWWSEVAFPAFETNEMIIWPSNSASD